MRIPLTVCKPVFLASALLLGHVPSTAAGATDIELLLEQLADPEAQNWEALERQILREWSRSGSAAMDLLLTRGMEALRNGNHDIALEHFTALTDHAPDFAEGWNVRATVLYRMGLYGLAMEDIGKALALNPRHFGAMKGLATVCQKLGMQEEALEVWRAIQTVHPHSPGLEQGIKALEESLGGQRL